MSVSSASHILGPWAHRIPPFKTVVCKLWGRRFRRVLAQSGTAIACLALLLVEVRASWLESHTFAAIATRVTYRVRSGPSSSISFPSAGPYDERLGYSRIPDFVTRSHLDGYVVSAQARDSMSYMTLTRLGVYPIYHEKTQAGLQVLDRDGKPLVDLRFPQRTYREYSEIPGVVVDTLLFIENRTILDPSYPNHNPAIEWPRLSHAVVDYGLHALTPRHKVIGASTLATQLEKMRHSPRGRTHSPGEKLNQMLAASLRVYQDGRDTVAAQQRIVRDYLNSLPLAASPGNGEVIGLGDGLWAWYAADFEDVTRLLRTPAQHLDADERQRQALAFREVLSLLLATRSPLRYLTLDSGELAEQTNRYLRVLCTEGIISPDLRDLALRQHPSIRPPQPAAETDYLENKASNLVRATLYPLLGVESTYTLNRLDLSVLTTIDGTAQRNTTSLLRGLTGSDSRTVAKLRQHRMLAQSDPHSVIYSFTLFERGSGLNLLRIQTDTFNQPLNINQGTKLELGSTAKLRTLINYLQIVERLHAQYSSLPALERADPGADPLTAWAVNYLSTAPDKSLRPMLEAALDRRYSASSAEGFFTAGGLHRFRNFDSSDDGRIISVREAFERSVNLVFIRLMRDTERYYLFRLPVPTGGTDGYDEQRKRYLVRFADQEGRVFLSRFDRKYRGRSLDEALKMLGDANATSPRRLAVIYRSVQPDASAADFATFLRRHVLPGLVGETEIARLYEKYAPGNFNLQDRGYLARVHPLELWLLWYKGQHPGATLSEVVRASADERQQAYEWLFRTSHSKGQDRRIRILQEEDAFQQIAREWKRLGYPFEQLVPSYATAIGVSGDTPAALAELLGIVGNGGFRYPTSSIRELRFADRTPMATILARQPAAGDRVLSEGIAALVREELVAVVESGTARRAAGGVALESGKVLSLGGKTGTGDNRVRVYAGRGYLVGSRVASRTAVFAFIVGDRFFGTVMAFVPGTTAGNYEFTSALAVQVFKELEPTLRPLLER
jgi:membrane peptidoglycan carboxypeptidase